MQKIDPRVIADFLIGNRPDPAQRMVVKDVRNLANMIPGIDGRTAVKVGKFAGRVAPALSVMGNVGDVVDLATGDENILNKGMDVVSMGAGGTIGGMLGGPLGASIGASTGKFVSDGVQYLFGGGKSPEERKLEEALIALKAGGMV